MVESDFFSDTDPSSFDEFVEAQRRLGPSGRVQQVFELVELAAQASEAGVRMMYPEADDREVFLRVAARRLGAETVEQVYGWNPDSDSNPG